MIEEKPGWLGRQFGRKGDADKPVPTEVGTDAFVVAVGNHDRHKEINDLKTDAEHKPSKEESRPSVPLVLSAPGAKAKQVLAFLYSKKSYDEIFEPTIEDMRFEYCEALKKKELWHARWIHARCIIGLVWTSVSYLVSVLWSLISKKFHPGGPSPT